MVSSVPKLGSSHHIHWHWQVPRLGASPTRLRPGMHLKKQIRVSLIHPRIIPDIRLSRRVKCPCERTWKPNAPEQHGHGYTTMALLTVTVTGMHIISKRHRSTFYGQTKCASLFARCPGNDIAGKLPLQRVEGPSVVSPCHAQVSSKTLKNG